MYAAVSKGWLDMAEKLESLRAAENNARQIVEEARREAQKVRIGITALVDELESRTNRNLSRSRKSSEERIRNDVVRLRTELETREALLLSELESRASIIEQKAVELLGGIIRDDGDRS